MDDCEKCMCFNELFHAQPPIKNFLSSQQATTVAAQIYSIQTADPFRLKTKTNQTTKV